MAAIRTSEWSPQAKAPLGKIQPVADGRAYPVKRHPAHILLTDAALKHQVFDQTSNRIVRQRGYDPRVHRKATPEPAVDVVFASTLPRPKMTGRGDSFVARVESQHDFSEADQVPHAAVLRFDVQLRHDLYDVTSRD